MAIYCFVQKEKKSTLKGKKWICLYWFSVQPEALSSSHSSQIHKCAESSSDTFTLMFICYNANYAVVSARKRIVLRANIGCVNFSMINRKENCPGEQEQMRNRAKSPPDCHRTTHGSSSNKLSKDTYRNKGNHSIGEEIFSSADMKVMSL